MSAKRFESKIDAWLLIVFVIAMGVQVAAFASVIYRGVDAMTAVLIVGATLAVFALVGSILRYTYYTVDNESLKIVSGPFRWRVSLTDIESVSATRSPLSSPALSLDRLKIRYGKRRVVMVSPADKRGFVRALGVELS